MYSTPSGFKWRARGGRVSRFHWFKGSPESCCSPSLSPPCAKTLRTTGEPSPTPLPWKSIDFLEFRFNFVIHLNFQPTTNCSLLPQISFEPFFILLKTDFATTHTHFVKLLLDQSLWIPPSPHRAPPLRVEHNIPLWSRLHQSLQTGMTAVGGEGAVVFILIYKCVSVCVSGCVSLNVLCKEPNFIKWRRFW